MSDMASGSSFDPVMRPRTRTGTGAPTLPPTVTGSANGTVGFDDAGTDLRSIGKTRAVWLTWQQAAWLGVVCIAACVLTFRLPHTTDARPGWRLARGSRSVVREVGIVASLYALWQWVFTLTVTETAGGIEHARSIFRFEQRIGLPSEVTIQRLTMHSRIVTEALNRYYAYVHVPALGIMIVWLYFRHRGHYPRVRNVLALATGACLAIQSIPVAPPRFLPGLGFVDTALLYGQSVYGAGGSGISNQLAAMPSVHVAWSVLVAAAVVGASPSRWRWLVVAHPVITVWAVVATGNHWWLDGIVSVILLVVAYTLLEALARLFPRPDRPADVGATRADPDRAEHDRDPVAVAIGRVDT